MIVTNPSEIREMEESIIVDTTDRISQLPEFIVHHILSFLYSPADLVRSSVLSKKWFALTASFPILDFTFRRFTKPLDASGIPFIDLLSLDFLSGIPIDVFKDTGEIRGKFWKYVSYTIDRFCKENVSAHTFNLITMIQNPIEADIVDKCINLMIKKGVQVLMIHIFHHLHLDPPLIPYRLPNILLSSSSLTSLTIWGCELPSSLMVDDVKFKFLKLLDLHYVHIDEEMIKRLTTSCRLLEEIKIYRCDGFKTVCINALYNIRKVRIDYDRGLERIDIEAPNLSHLSLIDWGGIGAPSLNLASCIKLTTLCFCGFFSQNSIGFANFLTNFPFIENLFLTTTEHCKNLKLSSNSLRTLVLHSKCQLDEIEISTPNLLLFKYSRNTFLSDPVIRNSAESKACMECYPNDDVDTLWFQKLRRFLDKKNRFRVLKLHFFASFIDVEEPNIIHSPPYELEHLELELETIEGLSVYLALVDAVLCCCCPQSLTLISNFPSIDFEERNHVVKFTYEKLIQQEDQSQSDIQIMLSSFSKAKNRFGNLDSLLASLPCDRIRQTITFVKGRSDLNSCPKRRIMKQSRYANVETA